LPLIAAARITPEQVSALRAGMVALAATPQGARELAAIDLKGFDTDPQARLLALLQWLEAKSRRRNENGLTLHDESPRPSQRSTGAIRPVRPVGLPGALRRFAAGHAVAVGDGITRGGTHLGAGHVAGRGLHGHTALLTGGRHVAGRIGAHVLALHAAGQHRRIGKGASPAAGAAKALPDSSRAAETAAMEAWILVMMAFLSGSESLG
jgi:hypothetical protein